MIPLSTQFYRLLLFAYPAPFRHEYAGQMTSLFQARCADEITTSGVSGLFVLWLEVLLDTAISAPQGAYVHVDSGRSIRLPVRCENPPGSRWRRWSVWGWESAPAPRFSAS